MSQHIIFSSPFNKVFSHLDHTIGTGAPVLVRAAISPSQSNNKRVFAFVQNNSTTAIVNVVLNATDTNGIHLLAGQSLTLENYNGPIYAFSNTAATLIHTAVGIV